MHFQINHMDSHAVKHLTQNRCNMVQNTNENVKEDLLTHRLVAYELYDKITVFYKQQAGHIYH